MAVLTATRRPPERALAAVTARPLVGAVLAVYLVVGGFVVAHHEPWFDEAQAWLLARDTGPLSLLSDRLRYEGSPGLWHLLLMLPAKAGLPYLSLNVVSLLLGAVATFLFVRYSPFPTLVKIAFPFTYFALYQYAVVARSYALLAPLLFLLAHLFPRKVERVYAFTAVLCLLANVSVHGLLIAGSVMAVHVWDVWRQRRELGRDVLGRQVRAVAAFGGMCLLIVLILLPPDDVTFAPGTRFDARHARHTVETLLGGALTERLWLSLLVLAASVWWFRRSGRLALFLLPTTAVLGFSAVRYWNVWHQGTLLLVWVFVLWVTLGDRGRRRRSRVDEWSRLGALAALSAVVLVQLVWSARAVHFDTRNSYSGSRALARYIEAHDLGRSTVYATGWPAVAVLPYFDDNPFANHNGGAPPSYWSWSTRKTMVEDPAEILRARPDYVVLSVKFPGQERQAERFPGYRTVRSFDGGLWWKNGIFEADSYILLERAR